MVENHLSPLIPGGTNNTLPKEQVNWNVVKLIVEGYTERFPEEVMGCAEFVKQKKAEKGLMNDYALMDNKGSGSDRRYMYELPPRLFTALTLKYPSILTGKNLIKFLKTYTLFCIPDKL